MYCKFCGKQQDDGAFCKYCGRKQYDEAPAAELAAAETELTDDTPDYGYDDAQAYGYDHAQQETEIGKKKINPAVIAAIVGAVVLCITAAVCLAMISGKDDEIDTDPKGKTSSSQSDTSSEKETPSSDSSKADTSSDTPSDSSEAESEPQPVIDHEGWKEAYLEKAFEVEKKYYANPHYGSLEWVDYCLVDIDGDGFEELFIQHGAGGGSTVETLSTYRSGELIEIMDKSFSGAVVFPEGENGIYFNSYSTDKETGLYIVENDKLVAAGEYGGELIFTYELEKYAQNFEEFAALLGLGLPEKYEKLKQEVIIPASDLYWLSGSEIYAMIGENYREITWTYNNGATVRGYTSDKYFPGVILEPYGGVDNTELYAAPSFFISVYGNGLMGDNAYVGMTYNEILVLIDSLNGVGPTGAAHGMIDGFEAYLYFDNGEDLDAILISMKKLYGNTDFGRVMDAYDIDPVCTGVSFLKEFGYPSEHCEVDCDKEAPLRNAPHDGASILWYVPDGANIEIMGYKDTYKDDEWVCVCAYYTDSGVRKYGYMKKEYIDMD